MTALVIYYPDAGTATVLVTSMSESAVISAAKAYLGERVPDSETIAEEEAISHAVAFGSDYHDGYFPDGPELDEDDQKFTDVLEDLDPDITIFDKVTVVEVE